MPAQQSDSKPFCDVAEEMRARVESYDAGWNMVRGQTVVSIDSMREWADAMERAAEIIEGPPDYCVMCGRAAGDPEGTPGCPPCDRRIAALTGTQPLSREEER